MEEQVQVTRPDLVVDILNAEVYEPSGGFKTYAIVLGANLTRSQAEALRDEARAAGWPPRTDIWQLGSPPPGQLYS